MHICFVSLKSYDLVCENPQPGYIGGAQRQQVLVARGLQQLGYDVSFVTLDHGQPDGIEHNGIRVFKAYKANRGLPVLRAVMPRWTGLCAALRRANADAYHQMCADSESGQVALWCRRNGKRFIFAVASDTDCDPKLPRLQTRRQRMLYRYALQHADHVVTQTLSQQTRMKKGFGVNSTVIPSCTQEAEKVQRTNRLKTFPKGDQITLAWVSRVVPLKRLEWLLDLAVKCPNYRFLIVGGGDDSNSYVQGLTARARGISNVEMLGRVSDTQLWNVYERADLLLDTAAIAGVPTTFLEAWARGVPVVSTVDPDDVMTSNNLGRLVADVPAMAQAIANFVNKPEQWLECSRAARDHYKQHHTVEAVSAAYHRLFTWLNSGTSEAIRAWQPQSENKEWSDDRGKSKPREQKTLRGV